jgi:mannose-1-phosphate guanylyltransferase/phosphomannomutase
LVEAMGADLGVILEPSGERLFLLDERGEAVEDERLLLLLLEHTCRQSPGIVALPLHITRRAEEVAAGCGATVRRTRSSDADLMAEATEPAIIFAGTDRGGYIFPAFLPSMDALLTLGKVLELAALSPEPLSQRAAQLPDVYVAHGVVPCPWQVKGAVMRLMVEELKDEPISLEDGIKVATDGEWVQILPDADEPLFHIYAEADINGRADEIIAAYKQRLAAVIEERRALED